MSKIDVKSKNLLNTQNGQVNLTFVWSKKYLKTDLILQLKFNFSKKIDFNQPIYK